MGQLALLPAVGAVQSAVARLLLHNFDCKAVVSAGCLPVPMAPAPAAAAPPLLQRFKP
jgi:hypothetical protein